MVKPNMDTQVALISMPFSPPGRPSLGLSLLKAHLARQNISADIHYFNLWFDQIFPQPLSQAILYGESAQYDLAGDWLFQAALGGLDEETDRQYLEQVLGGRSKHHRKRNQAKAEQFKVELLEARHLVEPFLRDCLRAVAWEQYRLVGFSSVFQQQVASLALARRLKEKFPQLFILFGGSNCHSDMGQAVLRCFPFVDAVCLGEGDLGFAQLVGDALAGRALGSYPGFIHRANGHQPMDELLFSHSPLPLPEAPVNDMDALPYPDFEDYIAAWQKLPEARRPAPQLLFESSRGCWWGAKSHCTFCGLNGNTMAFRAKSPERALAELQWLVDEYGHITTEISTVDNIIPHHYSKTFLPLVIEADLDLNLFYETKANLRQEEIEIYAKAGIRDIQPGIESLSTPVLKLMRKGVTALQNIRLLKWCRQFDIGPGWNYLIGFPGERPEDYAGQVELIQAISHLQPPPGLGRVHFDKFSPYYTDAAHFGISDLRPYPAYDFVYRGLPAQDIANLAYYFVGEYTGQADLDRMIEPLRQAIQKWQENFKQSALFSVHFDDAILVCDLRPDLNPDRPFWTLRGAQKRLLELCHDIRSRATLVRRLGQVELEQALPPLLEAQIIISEDGNYLGLPVPLGFGYAVTGPALTKFVAILQALRANGSVHEGKVVIS